MAGLPEHKIRIISPDIGGGFGNKVGVYPGYVCSIVGSIVTGKPVKWMEDRTENLMSTVVRPRLPHEGEIAATKDGKILGRRVDVLADHGAFNGAAQPTKFPAGFFHIFSRLVRLLEAAHCKVKAVYTNKAPGRRRLRLLVPHHRGRLPRRADRRLPRARAEDRPDRAAA